MPERLALRPPLKWAGGKRWLVSHLQPLWEPHRHRRLVEPFCGGLAVTLGLLPERALLNDANPHLINFYRWLQRGLVIPWAMRNDREAYYEARARFNRLIQEGQWQSAEAAGLFYYLNRTGYNGLCRFNRAGFFNVPFGRYRTIAYESDFRAYRPLLGRWEFTTMRFTELPVAAEDFIYADPPYDVEFTQYAAGGFGWNDQVELAQWLARHPGPVVASNQATERIIRLYEGLGFALQFLTAPRLISCTGERRPAREILALRGV
mgnify:CR=1 FL=1